MARPKTQQPKKIDNFTLEVSELPQYDILRCPVAAIDQNTPGKMFKDSSYAWEKHYSRMFEIGYVLKQIVPDSGYMYFLFELNGQA